MIWKCCMTDSDGRMAKVIKSWKRVRVGGFSDVLFTKYMSFLIESIRLNYLYFGV
ncbi:hypothetical protein HanHA300_Chr01g0026081 [Helianthus annuus]|nr:hypothetical protein HanHA300_Chr01g0026081 [Helianthus annuus]KAJ0627649.1 hypothetical protein HanHA89_Chr01g0028151 [Helianthus annuus]KAJ0783948.1 hypothetical protein HanLR1_Chr01g0026731 [Helianthus annuus]